MTISLLPPIHRRYPYRRSTTVGTWERRPPAVDPPKDPTPDYPPKDKISLGSFFYISTYFVIPPLRHIIKEIMAENHLIFSHYQYPEPGSNRHGLLQRCLRPSRLPIPPSGHQAIGFAPTKVSIILRHPNATAPFLVPL